MGRAQLEIKYLKRLLWGHHNFFFFFKKTTPPRITGVCKFLESSMNFIVYELYIDRKLSMCVSYFDFGWGWPYTKYLLYLQILY